MPDTVLITGRCGRAHALAWKLSQSNLVGKIVVAPGNAGTAMTPKTTNLTWDMKDHTEIVNWCCNNRVDFAIVVQEFLLDRGMADDLNAAGIPCFGPPKAGAKIESSKAFAKKFMDKYGIPTAQYKIFKEPEPAKQYINNANHQALVVKASGLSWGRGVIVAEDKAEAVAAVKSIMEDKRFGTAGDTIVVEELLKGEEVSVFAFTDGTTVSVMPPAQDHKRAFEGDKGPNTGGMGAYCPCPLVSKDTLKFIETDIIQRLVDGMNAENVCYIGVIFAGIMLTDDGPKVLEFNCRFGDPETESILPLLESDIYPTLRACVRRSLKDALPKWNWNLTACGILMVSGGYAEDNFTTGKIVEGLDKLKKRQDVMVFFADSILDTKTDTVLTSGGRVLVTVGLNSSLSASSAIALEAAQIVKYDGAFYRRDIAHRALGSPKIY